MSPKPTIVIIPGSWQTPAAWTPFQTVLTAAGFPAEYVKLPTVGGTTLPLASLADDVTAVRAVLAPLVAAGKDIVLLCHSSGGLVGSNAVEGFGVASRKAAGELGGVVLVVFLSAFMLPKGKSLLETLGGTPPPWLVLEVSTPLRLSLPRTVDSSLF